jgi:hypothetical protein
VAAAVAAMVLVATGCSRSADQSEDLGTVERFDALVAGTIGGSVRIDYRLSNQQDGVRIAGSGTAVVHFERHVSNLQVAMEAEPILPARAVDEGAGPFVLRTELRTIGSRQWSRMWAGDAEPGPWVEEERPFGSPEADGGATLKSMLDDPLAFDAKRFFDLVTTEATSVHEVGPETVRGVSTTRYRADIPKGTLGEDYSFASERADRLDVWVDQQRRARRIQAGPMTIDLSDFGVDVGVEPPEDVVARDDIVNPLSAQVTGSWAVQATGTTAGVDWRVFAAAAELFGNATVCRTFEPERAQAPPDGPDHDRVGESAGALPNHAGRSAVCGSSAFGIPGMAWPRPAVQVLPSWAPFEDDIHEPYLVALAVDPRFPTDEIRLERVSGGAATVSVGPGGVAVWDSTGSSRVTKVVVAGGTIECKVAGLLDAEVPQETGPGQTGSMPVDEGPAPLGADLDRGLEPCVRVG